MEQSAATSVQAGRAKKSRRVILFVAFVIAVIGAALVFDGNRGSAATTWYLSAHDKKTNDKVKKQTIQASRPPVSPNSQRLDEEDDDKTMKKAAPPPFSLAPEVLVPATSPAPTTKGKTKKSTPSPKPGKSEAEAALCPTTTPAAPGTPFPCATRERPFNSHEFFKWSEIEEKRKSKILQAELKSCGSASTSFETTHVRLAGCSGTSGQWNRCWIIAMTGEVNTSRVRPSCASGDHFDVQIENDVAKVGVDRVFDLGNGAYEVQFYIRKRGVYQIRVDTLVPHQAVLNPAANFLRLGFSKNTNPASDPIVNMVGLNMSPAIAARSQALQQPRLNASLATPPWPKNVMTFEGSYVAGVDVVPLKQRCDEVYDVDRFRYGAWFRVGSCDGVHCVGNLEQRNMDGWLFVFDVCIINVLGSAEDLFQLLSGSWMLGWGGSTMKQPMSNFVELYLKRPIFRVFMSQLDTLKTKKRPNFFSYRQWDITPGNGSRVTMMWGGCPSLVAAPNCPNQIGLRYWQKIDNLIGKAPTAKRSATAFPALFVMDMTVWRAPQDDDAEYFDSIGDLFNKIDRKLEEWKEPTPLLVWHTTPAGGNSDRGVRHFSVPNSFTTSIRTFNWGHEDYFDARFLRNASYLREPVIPGATRRPPVMISRHAITLPLHFSNEWVHFGLHYGASEGMCNTGHERRGYEFKNCVAKTWADDMVILAWLNAFSEHRQFRQHPPQ